MTRLALFLAGLLLGIAFGEVERDAALWWKG